MNISDVTAMVDGVSAKVPLTDGVKTAIQAALTPAPVPLVVRAITRVIATAAKGMPTQGYLIGKKGDRQIVDTSFEGWSNGIVHQSSPGTLTLDNVRVLDSLGGVQEGHGIYADDAGQIILRNSLLGWNGNPRNAPAGFKPNVFRHNAYFNLRSAAPLVEDTIIIGAGNAGAQTRSLNGVSTFRNVVFIDNGIGLLNIMSRVRCEHCLFFSTRPYWDGTGWAGNVPIFSYYPVELLDTYIVQRQGQSAAVALNTGGTWKHEGYPQFIAPAAGPLVVAKDSVISGFKTPFAGPKPHDGSGFKLYGTTVDYDPLPLVNQYLAGELSAGSAIAAIQAAVRGQVK